jgi:hypothetical protein
MVFVEVSRVGAVVATLLGHLTNLLEPPLVLARALDGVYPSFPPKYKPHLSNRGS